MSEPNTPFHRQRVNTQPLITKKKTGSTQNSARNSPLPQKRITINKIIAKTLPHLNYSEPDQIMFLKSAYEDFSGAVTRFLKTASTDVSYKDSLKMRITDTDWNFNVFYTSLQKQNNILMQTRYNNNTPIRGNFISATESFTSDLKRLIDLLSSIQSTGAKDIVTSLKVNFATVNDKLDIVITHPSKYASMHDPTIPLAKCLQTQALKMKNFILQVYDNPDIQNQHQILIDMRKFSNDLNNAFTGQFTNCCYGLIENEKIRAISMAACNDLLHGMRSLIMFKSQMSDSFIEFEKFRAHINPILGNFGLPILDDDFFASPLEEEEDNNEEKHKRPELNESMTLKEILSISYKWLKKGCTDNDFFEHFYKVTHEKAKSIERSETDLLTKVSDLQIQNVELISQIKSLDMQNKKLEKSILAGGENSVVEEYYKCMMHISQRLKKYLNDKTEFVPIDSKHLVEHIISIVDSLFERRCPTCVALENAINKAKANLKPIITFDSDIPTVAKFVCDEYLRLKEDYQKITNDFYSIGSGYDSSVKMIAEILKEFPAADPNNKDPCNEIINQIRIERESHKAQIAHEQKMADKRLHARDVEISKKFALMFGTYHQQPIFDQFETHEEEIKREKAVTEHYLNIIKDTERVISKFLCFNVRNRDTLEVVPILLEKLENYVNPLEEKVKTLELSQVRGLRNINEIEKKVLAILGREIVDHKESFDEAVESLTSIVDNIAIIVDEVERNKRLKKWMSSNIHTKLELIDNKLCTYLHAEEVEDIENAEITIIISRISNFVDQVIKMASENEPTPVGAVNEICDKILSTIKETNHVDPLKYLPEVVYNYQIYYDSIEATKPFAEILNTASHIFEKKVSSLAPGTEEYKSLRKEIYKLHNELNEIRLSKVHSALFLVLSRFVALLSAFLSTLSTISLQKSGDIIVDSLSGLLE
ncbi:hypothetical protein TRFO_12751 [Tritrichomonas foetus]|uniref:Uncharacterized protein n=1 Tax=Tritrichomonas foetus TaxID=1144522 RepID=A0A1J4L0U5_9EUKA|nr:hypothetical protein TRFO_12751 [Tritrichomonas foetus]|eukprot:OHT17042.1 hypothetical protein TRFO_12751 [Tritrichomonas foetus]